MDDRMRMKPPPPRERGRLAEIARQARVALKLIGDRRVPLALKLIPLAAVGYLVFPLDADFIPVAGQIDDLAVILIALRLFIELSPKDVVAQVDDGVAVTTTYSVRED
jgi:uncharacterized membrane protein YkvA (DUF1232 family)